MEDVWYEIPELADQTRARIPDAKAKATYSAGPSYLKQTGSPAALWIGIFNSTLNGGPIEPMETLAHDVAADGFEWLRRKDLAHTETVVQVAFGDMKESIIFHWSNTLETISFVIAADGSLQRVKSQLTPEEEEKFRRMRYFMSGR